MTGELRRCYGECRPDCLQQRFFAAWMHTRRNQMFKRFLRGGGCEDATNNNQHDIVSSFSGGLGSGFYAFFGGSIDNYYSNTPYNYTRNTWYRQVLQCLPGQDI